MPLTNDVMTHPYRCPECGYLADAAAQLDPEQGSIPAEGDYSLCFNCGSINIFMGNDANLHVRKMTPKDAHELLGEPNGPSHLLRLMAMQQKIREFWEENPRSEEEEEDQDE